jgi:hypothetical protein
MNTFMEFQQRSLQIHMTKTMTIEDSTFIIYKFATDQNIPDGFAREFRKDLNIFKLQWRTTYNQLSLGHQQEWLCRYVIWRRHFVIFG